MGIYIEGMEMPKRGMVVNIYADGRVTNHFDEFGKTIGKAVSVPPHGKLIDADALKSDGFHTLVCYTGKMPYEYIAMRIDDAPTVIEAEEGE